MQEQRSAQIRLSFDGDSRSSFDVLREKLREQDLFSEEFGANDDSSLMNRFARAHKDDGNQQRGDESGKGSPHIQCQNESFPRIKKPSLR